MGYAGNYEPNYIVPTLISVVAESNKPGTKKDEVGDLDFYIGAEASVKRENYNVDYPIRHGIIDNWDNMEKYWSRCIYQYLCCDPEEHYMLLVSFPLFALSRPSLMFLIHLIFADGASHEHSREQRVHCGNHV